jgi:predicted HTH transcriptional regulator
MSNGNASPELIAVLLKGVESKDLDYKSPISWDESGKKSCCAIVKDILGMANTLGGFIVIGVSETPTGFSWDGLTQAQLDTFDTSRLNRFLQNYADPPINARCGRSSIRASIS